MTPNKSSFLDTLFDALLWDLSQKGGVPVD